MSNYYDCRIRCSMDTAEKIISYGENGFFDGILDMNKALGLDPDPYLYTGVCFGKGCPITVTEDGRIDIGFEIRNYPDLECFRQLIEKYQDVEWWMEFEWEDIFHWYYQDGEVVEDVYHVSEEEQGYIDKLLDDDEEAYVVIYTEKADQKKYVNLHLTEGSREEKEYEELVETIADWFIKENRFSNYEKYDYHWTGGYRHFGMTFSVMHSDIFKDMVDTKKYKPNILARDVIDAIQERVFPYDYKLYHAIFGLAIGDALGVPYEFEERGTFECKDMIGGGSHNQPEGTWSDDTSMTLATLKSIKDNNGKIVIDDIRKNFLLWINEGKFTANGNLFDVGHATLKALIEGKPQTGEYSNGNGSLMRILPLAFTDCSDDEIREVSAITHGHWISKEACVIYVHVARRLLAGDDIHDIIPTLKYDKPFDRLSYIDKLPESEIRSTGYVVDTLEAALWAVSHIVRVDEHSIILKDFSNDVLDAINLGDDTDTVGAVTGGLAGIMYNLGYYGHGRWFEKLRNKHVILRCLW